MTDVLRFLLVDDEPLALRRLQSALVQHEDVEVVGTARDGDAALEEARRLKPDIIILDVEMPGRNGMSVAAELDRTDGAEIIFLSAFDRYAATAFEFEALDYLVKPLRLERLSQALERARQRRAERTAHASARAMERDAEARSIHIPDRHGGRDLPLSHVIWIEAARDYAILHTRMRSHMLRITMAELARQLPAAIVRVHRSAFVNLAEVRRWGSPAKGVHSIILSDGTSVGVGPSYVADLRQALRSLPV